jgi:hypothetical protein
MDSIKLDLENLNILGSNGESLLFGDVTTPLNPYHQGQYSTNIASLSTVAISEIAYPESKVRPKLSEIDEMQKRDAVVAQCLALKSLRASREFGAYSHPVSEIESFIVSNIGTLDVNFRRTLFKILSSVILYGVCFAEFTFTSKAKGFGGQWRLKKINVLDPRRVKGIKGKDGKILAITYDRGDGKDVDIPYAKCLHIINNAASVFDEDEIWGVGDGACALNYYKLKKIVLTQLALAVKNNATGLLHARTDNVGRTILVDSKMAPLRDAQGKPMEVTKQVALNYQLQDIHTKDYIVTEGDVSIQRIQIQNNENFWQYVLDYIDKSIQRSFGVPSGIFDAGMSGLQNVGLTQNHKSVFDSGIMALTDLLKQEIISKVVRRLLIFNFSHDTFKNNYGEFRFEPEEDEQSVNSRLSTISSLIASGILDSNDPDLLILIKKKLGLPTLDAREKEEVAVARESTSETKELRQMMEKLQTQIGVLQAQQQIDMLQNPQPQPPAEEGAPPAEEAAPPEGQEAEMAGE